MERYTCCLITVALAVSLLAGCRGADGNADRPGHQEGQVLSEYASNDEDDGELSSTGGEQSEPAPDPEPKMEGEINTGLSIVPQAGGLLDLEDGLFLLKEYGTDMGWSEANQLEHLERGTPYDEVGQSDVYYLLIPKFAGSRVEVNRLAYDSGMGPYPAQSLYLNADTPDSYGLLLTSREPEGLPELAVTVEYDGAAYTHQFVYDGRGDRSAIQLFHGTGAGPRESRDVYPYRWTSDGRQLEAQIPSNWTGGPHFIFDIEVDGEVVRYQVTFFDLQSGALENSLIPESTEEVHSLNLTDGRTCLYVLVRDSPIKYIYALEVDGMIQLVQAYCIPEVPETVNAIHYMRPPTETSDGFLSMLSTIRCTD